MRLLPLLEGGRKSSAIRYLILRQSPKAIIDRPSNTALRRDASWTLEGDEPDQVNTVASVALNLSATLAKPAEVP